MVRRFRLLTLIIGIAYFFSPAIPPSPSNRIEAQERQGEKPMLRVEVNLVQLNVAVTDGKGHYVTGLKPGDFTVTEDNIRQKIASFGEGNEPTMTVDTATGETRVEPNPAILAGANVFVLFDTSNYMYRSFALAQDAIADFVKSLDSPERIAFYSYSRNLYRAASLTADREQVLRGVRSTVAGDQPALYNALLLTLRDAGQIPGRKVLVIFSNGDRKSVV